MARTKNAEKTKRDFKIAEIVYYSIGGLVLFVGFVFSIFGVILFNPVKGNFENTFLKQAETAIFNFLNWQTDFTNAGLVLMLIATIYFAVIFLIFTKKGDDVEKINVNKQTRQRQFTFNPNPEVVETEVKEVTE